MLKRVVCGVSATAIALAPALAGAACFTEPEWRAAHVRILESDLQVAALECQNVVGHNYNDQYQAFLTRFGLRLKADAKLLIGHFQRSDGRDGQRQLDIFITKLANDASNRSMSDMSFCANSAAVFQTALAIDVAQLESTALDRIADHSEVGDECPIKEAARGSGKSAAAPVKTAAAKPIPPAAAKPAVQPASATVPAPIPTVGQAPAVQPASAIVPAPTPTVGQAPAVQPASATVGQPQPSQPAAQPPAAQPPTNQPPASPAVQSAEKPAAAKKPDAAPGSAS